MTGAVWYQILRLLVRGYLGRLTMNNVFYVP